MSWTVWIYPVSVGLVFVANLIYSYKTKNGEKGWWWKK